ncbi:hypothetical protein RRF57_008882 [Xylaria bambusicola]|uniref:FAD-binding PCMH-type domain-containing protein n=1 Tax=Xylaria bambusicola TaxID=326684 RepID=A0AAN7UU30_9PEZI
MCECLALTSSLGHAKVAYPGNPAYEASLASYFSAQQETIRPACVILPKNVADVSGAIKNLAGDEAEERYRSAGGNGSLAGDTFAVRSGGHSSWAGASNIDNGVTIDLSRLSSGDVDVDGNTVRVSPAATWHAVYEKLDPIGRSVAGGRVASVGVGGLTLSGGISFLSPEHGWTCDTVLNFKVVLSDGTVVDANSRENTDLFFALPGEGNNFGIVTRIDLKTFEQSLLWSASLLSNTSVHDANINEFVRLSIAKDYDENASFLLSLAYIGSIGDSFIANTLQYTKAVENLLTLPTVQASTGLKSMATLSLEAEAMVPKGSRSFYRTHTLVSTEDVLQAVYAARSGAVNVVRNISGISWVLSFDPIPPASYARHADSNALGLTGRDGATLLVVLLDARWKNKTDDKVVSFTAKALFDKIKKVAQSLGAYNLFIYLNYTEPDRNPIGTYGEESVRRLNTVCRRVDAAEVFTKQVEGCKIPSV